MLCNQSSRDAQQEITKEKNARAETNYAVAEAQVTGHLKCRGADVHAVQEGDDVKQKQKGKEPPCNAASCALGDPYVGCDGHVDLNFWGRCDGLQIHRADQQILATEGGGVPRKSSAYRPDPTARKQLQKIA